MRTKNTSKIITGITFFLSILLVNIVYSQSALLTELDDFKPGEMKVAGFVIDEESELKIEAKSLYPSKKYDHHLSHAWILNTDTREKVWNLNMASKEDKDDEYLILEDEISLKAGSYEVYFSTFPYSYRHYFFGKGFFKRLFSSFDEDDEWRKYHDYDYDELYIRIHGRGTAISEEGLESKLNKSKAQAFVSFTKLQDRQKVQRIFRVSKPTPIHVYAIGEVLKDGQYDFGWIINTRTREKVWQLNYRYSERAGGAKKNRLSNEKLTLDPGDYQVIFITDDSHSYDKWNSAPPDDPSFWGITIRIQNPSDLANLTLLDEADSFTKNFLEFEKVRDEDYRSQGFTLKKTSDVYVFALGEGSDGDMYDYGWIVRAKDRKTVWKMKYSETEAAGGAQKNRMFDGIIHLEPGNYMVYYITDDSHAYHSWNDDPPFDETKWGISLAVEDSKYNEGSISLFEEADDEKTLIKLTQIRDDERKRAKFTQEKDGLVSIYSIGEGSGGDMYDYAWIEDANNGRVVWEMTYKTTTRAGGARKNRLFDDRIFLKAGEYIVYYESDDSHSFEAWNDSPPEDPFNWGITVCKVGE